MAQRAPLKLRDRLNSLMNKRVVLKKRIADELARPAPDAVRLRTLKRMRVRLKDQVALLLQEIRAGQVRTGNGRPSGDAA